jgi:pyruvate dehydrogenase E1 component alpha subunit
MGAGVYALHWNSGQQYQRRAASTNRRAIIAPRVHAPLPVIDTRRSMAKTLDVYRHAVRARLLDDRLAVLSRAGRIGYHPDAQRAEVVICAATLELEAGDWVFPTPRDHAAAFVRGASLERYLHHVLGSAGDVQLGHASPGVFASKEHHVGCPSPLLAQHLTEATGFAWAMRLRKDPGAVLTFLPETAADAGDFHSAVNFAGVTKAPIVFVVRTDGSEAPAPDVEVVDKTVAYGIAGLSVTGHADTVGRAVHEALVRARHGEGPTLIEARIRTEPDPLLELRLELSAAGHLTDASDFDLRREIMAEIESAYEKARSAPMPSKDSLFEQVFAEVPAHLAMHRVGPGAH